MLTTANMIQATDFLSRVTPASRARRLNPNVTLKAINISFMDEFAGAKGFDTRSAALDAILDELREQWEAAKVDGA